MAQAPALGRRPRRLLTVTPAPTLSHGGDAWFRDLQFAARLIARQPGHTVLVVVTMALGISAATMLASVAYGVLLKPLPWADAPRLVRLYETREGSTRRFAPMMTNATYRAWQAAPSAALDALGAWSRENVILTELGEPRQVPAARVTPGLFEMLGASPEIGRTIVSGEERPGLR